MQIPIRLRNIARINLLLRRKIDAIIFTAGNVDWSINNSMRHMHALRRELSRQRHRQCVFREATCRKGSDTGVGFHGSGGAGEDERGRVHGVIFVFKEVRKCVLGEKEATFPIHRTNVSQLDCSNENIRNECHLHAHIMPGHELRLCNFEEIFSHKAAGRVEDGRRASGSRQLLFDFLESGRQAFGAGDVGGDTGCLAAGGSDFFDGLLVVLRIACQ